MNILTLTSLKDYGNFLTYPNLFVTKILLLGKKFFCAAENRCIDMEVIRSISSTFVILKINQSRWLKKGPAVDYFSSCSTFHKITLKNFLTNCGKWSSFKHDTQNYIAGSSTLVSSTARREILPSGRQNVSGYPNGVSRFNFQIA